LIPTEKGPLSSLLERAAFVVSEIYPVPPFNQWYRHHANVHPDLPWLLVDSTCLLPGIGAGRNFFPPDLFSTIACETTQR